MEGGALNHRERTKLRLPSNVLRRLLVAAICSLAVVGCGGQTRTVTVTAPQATSTSSPASAPAEATVSNPAARSASSTTATARTRSLPSVTPPTSGENCPPGTHYVNAVSACAPDWYAAEPWVVYAAHYGCPSGEVLAKAVEPGRPNDGCVSPGPYECQPTKATCDPANAPRTTPAQPATTPTTQTEAAPTPIDCGIIPGHATGQFDPSANRGHGGCVYTFGSGFKITSPPGTYLLSWESGGVGITGYQNCDHFYWSNGTMASAC